MWARAELCFLAPSVKGSTINLRQHLKQIAKSNKPNAHPEVIRMALEAQKELDSQGECPHQLVYIWNAFCELGWDFSWTDIQAWSSLTKRCLDHWEIKLLNRLSVIRKQVNDR